MFEQPSPSGEKYAAYAILEYDATHTEQDKSTAQDDHATPDYMDANEHPDQPAGSFTNDEVNVCYMRPQQTMVTTSTPNGSTLLTCQ